MDTITAFEPCPLLPDVDLLPAYCPIPGLGVLPMNAMLIRGAEPTLIDTGPAATSGEFLERLSQLVDLEDLRWVWITHADPDHTGALAAILSRAPRARVVTSFIGLGKLGLLGLVAPERAHLVQPGQALRIGDRDLIALRPPVYDAPESLAVFDGRTRALFAADSFGALLEAPAERAEELAPAALRRGLLTWASVDAPWLEHIPRDVFAAQLRELARLAPSGIFSAHLPPAFRITGALVENLLDASGAPAFIGPAPALGTPAS